MGTMLCSGIGAAFSLVACQQVLGLDEGVPATSATSSSSTSSANGGAGGGGTAAGRGGSDCAEPGTLVPTANALPSATT